MEAERREGPSGGSRREGEGAGQAPTIGARGREGSRRERGRNGDGSGRMGAKGQQLQAVGKNA